MTSFWIIQSLSYSVISWFQRTNKHFTHMHLYMKKTLFNLCTEASLSLASSIINKCKINMEWNNIKGEKGTKNHQNTSYLLVQRCYKILLSSCCKCKPTKLLSTKPQKQQTIRTQRTGIPSYVTYHRHTHMEKHMEKLI